MKFSQFIAIISLFGSTLAFAGGGPHNPGLPTTVVEGMTCKSVTGNIYFVLVTLRDAEGLRRYVEVSTSGAGGTLRGSAIPVYSQPLSNFVPIDPGAVLHLDTGIAIFQPQTGSIVYSSASEGQITLTYGPEAQQEGANAIVSETFACSLSN